ncbi:MAG: hypothetical protein ACEPOW_03880 [Bacteroidales bacterium]
MRKIKIALVLGFLLVGFAVQAQKVPESFRAKITKKTIYNFNADNKKYVKDSSEKLEGVVTLDPKRFNILTENGNEEMFFVFMKKEIAKEKLVQYRVQSKGKYSIIEIPFNKKSVNIRRNGQKISYKISEITIPALEQRPKKEK